LKKTTPESEELSDKHADGRSRRRGFQRELFRSRLIVARGMRKTLAGQIDCFEMFSTSRVEGPPELSQDLVKACYEMGE
jgi:hypothetical protein